MTELVPGLASVLMPVLNEAATIEAAVAAALAQTHEEVEVLVVDGRSTDETRYLVAKLAAGDARVSLLDNPARSISAGLNVGLAQARGQYIVRLDGHATVNDEYIALGVRHLRRDPGLAAVGGRRVGVATTPVGEAVVAALSSPFGVGDSINHYATEIQETDHCSFGVYRTEIARAVNGWDESLVANEDVDFDFRILGLGQGILYDPRMIINWHVRQNIPDLARQYRRYGRGKGAMVAKNGPAAVRARHLAAPALVAAMGAAGLLALTGRPRSALALVAPYGTAVLGATALTIPKARRQAAAVGGSFPAVAAAALPAAFVAMHTSWGVGFFEGLAGRLPAAASQR